MVVDCSITSTTPPSPDPSVSPTRGTSPVRARTAATASRTRRSRSAAGLYGVADMEGAHGDGPGRAWQGGRGECDVRSGERVGSNPAGPATVAYPDVHEFVCGLRARFRR